MPPGPSRTKGFLHRLSMYAFGIAIGLVFLAMIQRAKQISAPPPAESTTGPTEAPPPPPQDAAPPSP